ncbi:MAG: histidine kinase dimerization/phospho-acceptor domain-containing protein [Akkermansiaceae bacterium]
MSKSIKQQLLFGNILAITVIFAVICLGLFYFIKSFLYSQYDRSFENKYKLLKSLVEFTDDGGIITEWQEHGQLNPYGFDPALEGVSLWYNDGQEITHSGIPLEFVKNRAEKTININWDDKPIRVMSSIVFPLSDDDLDDVFISEFKSKAFISYAQIDTVAPYLSQLQSILITSWLSCVTFSSLILLWNTHRSLEPFNDLKAQIETMRVNRLQEIKLNTTTKEITPVTDSINKLLKRIQLGIEREKQLSSNIAHELKNPLAGLLNLWDVTLKRPRTPQEYVISGEQSLEATKQMVQLVRNLLGLSKLERGETRLTIENVNLSELLHLSWKPFEKTAMLKGIKVDWQIAKDFHVQTDTSFFNIIMSNIYDNLVCYADANSLAKIKLTEDGNISIGNHAHSLDPETSEKIFDALWRQSESRSEIGIHAGIGMALAHKLANILEHKISASVSSNLDWFEININLFPKSQN